VQKKIYSKISKKGNGKIVIEMAIKIFINLKKYAVETDYDIFFVDYA